MSAGHSNQELTVAVVGATGLVGQTMIRLLSERRFPVGDLRLMASGRSAGREVSFGEQRTTVVEAVPDAFHGVHLAFFSAGAEIAQELAPEAARRGALVIDNSAAWRMEHGVPLVVPEVNGEDAGTHEGIIANPNCSTMQLVPLLMALRDSVGIERVVVDTYQSVAGTGSEAIAELEGQIQAHARGVAPSAKVYPHPIAFNALPEIDVFLDDGYSREEWKVIHESRKILHLPELRLSCTAVRVPVFVGHSEAVHVETSRPIEPDEARRSFAEVPGVVVIDDPAAHRYPLATNAAGSDDIFVGRVRQDLSVPDGRGIAFWCVSDNLRKGAATNAIQIAELAVARNWLEPASRRAATPGSSGVDAAA
ncbi:MAG: aspartate-semialdehyde dehydrogenase [Chloroflexi bacterium]|nr:aspartate-semialdehyde dehydrogenase [Chloroflexota bacterium]